MEKIKNDLKLTIYQRGGSCWYCDYYFYNGITSEQGTTRAGGYGYDKHSTVISNAINKFNILYRFKNGLKWENMAHVRTKQNKILYGIYKDKCINYGIGFSSVINCLNAFSNVKIKQVYHGQKEDFVHLEITTTEKQLQKIIKDNQKIINNKKATKEDKKRAKNNIEKIRELYKMEG